MKEMKITPPEGYEVDIESIKFKPIKKGLPKSWEELGEIKGYYVDVDSFINTADTFSNNIHQNVFPTKEEAEASIALAQLCQLRDRYNGTWKPDWEDGAWEYTLEYYQEEISTDVYTDWRKVLSFKSREIRDEFLENFRDLIEKAKPLL